MPLSTGRRKWQELSSKWRLLQREQFNHLKRHNAKQPTTRSLIVTVLAAFSLSACAAPRTFNDAATFQGERYTFSIERIPDGLGRETSILINDEEVLRRSEGRDGDTCRKVSFYVSQCTFETSYRGMDVRVVEEIDAQVFQQAINYSIYFNDELVRRMTTPIL